MGWSEDWPVNCKLISFVSTTELSLIENGRERNWQATASPRFSVQSTTQVYLNDERSCLRVLYGRRSCIACCKKNDASQNALTIIRFYSTITIENQTDSPVNFVAWSPAHHLLLISGLRYACIGPLSLFVRKMHFNVFQWAIFSLRQQHKHSNEPVNNKLRSNIMTQWSP